MNGIVLTRRGRLVRALLLLVAFVALAVTVVWVGTHVPEHAPITDAAWRDGLAARLWEIRHGR